MPFDSERLYRYRLFLLGIRDEDLVARLWAEEQARRRQREGKRP
jgi:hypothetical protein